jgi:serine/threonine protein kinase
MQPGTASADASASPTGRTVAGYALGARLRTTACADVYRAERDGAVATVHIVHAALAARPEIVRAVEQQAMRAAAASDLRNLAATLGAGVDGGLLYVITEAEDGPTLREVLARKHAASGAGLPPRGAGNVINQIGMALQAAGLVHGALTSDSVTIARGGRITLSDLALGPALRGGHRRRAWSTAPGCLAPELARGEPPTAATDVYGLGALLVRRPGRPSAGPRRPAAERGRRPACAPEVDELIARACAERPERRFASAAALRELVADILLAVDEVSAEDDATAAAGQIAIPPALEAAMAGHPREVAGQQGPVRLRPVQR